VQTPNFFIIGAVKSGTTSMSEYLKTHPDIFVSPDKEPHYFSKDVWPSPYDSLECYLELFSGADAQHRIICEASTHYIRSSNALEKIRAFAPQAKVMAMLRRPTELVHAYHSELLRDSIETEWDFQKAWNLQDLRQKGKMIPKGQMPQHFEYRRMGNLGSQVRHLLDVFPREQVHFIVFDDLKADPRREYLRVLNFLGLPDDGRVEFPIVNGNINYKSRFVESAARKMSASFKPLTPFVKRILGVKQIGFVGFVEKFNVSEGSRKPLDPEFKAYLDDIFRDEVLLLERELGRNLPGWVKNIEVATRELELSQA
jgi:hypothetical protein